MLVHLGSTGLFRREDSSIAAFERLASLDQARRHTLVDDPADADLVLFTECHLLGDDWRLNAIRDSETYRAYASKSMVYDERDRPWCGLPGVYVSMPSKYFRPPRQRAWAYHTVEPRIGGTAPDLLFSFVGSNTARCRRWLFELDHPRAVIEKVVGFTFYDPSSKDFFSRRAHYDEVLARSKFVLCPRGGGTSSIRMYEAMSAGCVPVVISDGWVPPSGVDADSWMLRWPERSTKGLLAFLEGSEEEWPARSEAAVRAFHSFFAPEVAFDRIVEQCSRLGNPDPTTAFSRSLLNPGWRAAGLHAGRARAERRARGLVTHALPRGRCRLRGSGQQN